ncbi:MAG: DUF2200 domain-containing protein, partial [Cyanobacteria bacterium SZAS LIN-5]|nr:DUF2200 domain-containing protein [Cyanobacteria bacterium SZAS LIN-5]
MPDHKIYSMSFAKVYPAYLAKAEKKGRRKDEVDEIICWLTGYDPKGFSDQLSANVDFKTFFAQAPMLNPVRVKITGTICGVKVEEMDDSLMREIRYLDKLIDELSKGKPME